MEASLNRTGVTLSRPRDYFGIARNLDVLVDGCVVGDVAYGARIELELPPGEYSIQVQMDWCRSKPHIVHVNLGEMMELQGGLRWRGLAWRWSLIAVFLRPGWVFQVRPLEPEVSRSISIEAIEGIGLLAGIGLTFYAAFQLLMLVIRVFA